MLQKENRVSVIVSTYNSERFFQGCIENLVNQTLFKKNQLEIIVINSNSEQNEHLIINNFQNKFGFDKIKHFKTEQRETLYKAWNRGIEVSSGKYITYANTDDRFREDSLEILSNALDMNQSVSLVYDDCYITDIPNQNYDSCNKKKKYYYPEYFAPSSLLSFQFGIHPMWRREVNKETGMFDAEFIAAGDYDFNIRFALKQRALHIPETTGLYLIHKNSITQKDNSMQTENLKIYDKYVNFDNIEKLYAIEGFIPKNNNEKANLYSDMGIRAFKYYSPWLDNPVCNKDLAIRCFQKALDFEKTISGINNLAVVLFYSGMKKEALNLLEVSLKVIKNDIAEYNFELLKKDNFEKLILIPSGLNFASQKVLSNRFKS